MTLAQEKIKIDELHLEYDPLTESVIETSTGQTVYQETGIGEVDIRNCARGEETWEDGTPFTVDDFFTEIVIPDLYASGLII